MMKLRGKRALVMGLGVNAGGVGVARFLAEHGAEVTATDLRSATVLQASLDALKDLDVRYVLGEHRDEDFRQADIVIRNPGVPRESHFLQIAREHGAQIEMEMTLFFRLCPAPIIGITGTRGKTTTTMLAGAMLGAAYPDTVVAGNMRISALEQLARITPNTPVVLELSSWQLEGLGEAELSPQYACVTNMSPDHLDRYLDMDDYAFAKQQIVLHQQAERGDVAVLNADDERISGWQDVIKTTQGIAWFSTRKHGNELWAMTHNGVALGGAWWDGEQLMWNDEVVDLPLSLALKGEHNRANIAAATALAQVHRPAAGLEAVTHALGAFQGVPDRQELVREVRGVRFINDTTATTPTATIAALRALDAPVVLIAGGAEKHLDFDDLARYSGELARGELPRLKAVVLLAGTATARLATALEAAGVHPVGTFDQFEAAIRYAAELAEPGAVVLLSPACASFGMFVNEFDRGDQFRRIVGALA